MDVALLTQIEVEAVVALVPYSCDGDCLAAVTFYILLQLLSGLHDQFDVVSQVVVASNFEFLGVEFSGKIAILTHTKVVAISTHEARSDDGSHVAADALVIVVGC